MMEEAKVVVGHVGRTMGRAEETGWSRMLCEYTVLFASFSPLESPLRDRIFGLPSREWHMSSGQR